MIKRVVAVLLVSIMLLVSLPAAAKPDQETDTEMNMADTVSLPGQTKTAPEWKTWSQRDSRWGSLNLGWGTGVTVADYGCTATSITKLGIQSGCRDYSSWTVYNYVVTMNDYGGFNSGGAINSWYTAADSVGNGFEYWGQASYGSGVSSSGSVQSDIKSLVNEGIQLILEVPGYSGHHWVAVDNELTVANNQVWIMDSGSNTSNNSKPLTNDYSTVYRLVKFHGQVSYIGSISAGIHIEPGVYTIHSAWDWNKVLDIQGDDPNSGANIQLYDFLNNDVQKFRVVKEGDYYCIQSVYSGMWLDVASPVSQSGSNVQLWYTNANNEEKWQFQDAGNGYVYIRNYYGNYLDIQHDSTENCANIQVYGSITGNSQRWRLIREPEPVGIAEGVYTIHSARDWNMVLDIQGDSTDNRANIQLYENLNNTVQKFRVIRTGDYYYIQSVYSGLWLDVASPITESHSNVQLFENNSNPEEKWQFEDAGNGYLYIRNYYGNYVDIQGDLAVNNANIQVYHATINDSERWRLIPEPEPIDIAEGIYSIHSARDLNKVLDIQGDDPNSGANIQLYDFLDYDVQYFRIVKNGSKYCIQSVYSGMWLDVATPITESHSNVQLWFTNANNEEKWIFEDAGNGYVYIRNYYGNYVDLARDSTANNTNIQVYHAKESDSQRWLLVPLGGTPSPPPSLLGDADNNGAVDSVDALLILRYALGLVVSVPSFGNADVTGDGVVDSVDALMVLRHALGLITL